MVKNTKDDYIKIRVDKKTKKEIKEKAKKENRSMSNYIINKAKN